MEPAERAIEARRDPSSPLFDDEDLNELLEDDGAVPGKRGIRCPVCGWTPRSGDRWMCWCGHAWNTFDTGGRCPGCDRQWHDTQCLSCGAWSPHADWYFDEPEEGGAQP